MARRTGIARTIVPGLVALPALAGCVSVVTGRGDIAPFYERSLVVEATRDGGMPLVVHGSPDPSLDQAATEKLLLETITLPGWLTGAKLVPGSPEQQYRVVLIYNPVKVGQAMNRACGPLDRIEMPAPDDAKVTVVAAFCDRDDAATTSRGATDVGADPAGTTVRLTQQMMFAILPAENPNTRANIKVGP